MGNRQSESPKERINVTYKPATGDEAEDIELPYRMLVVGEFNPDEEFTTVEDKKAISVNKNNFDDVLQKQNLTIDISVPDKLGGDKDSTINANISIGSMKDFSPERIVDQVDELKKLQDLREALVALKGPLGNVPAFRKAIAGAIENPEEAAKILSELGLDKDEEEA